MYCNFPQYGGNQCFYGNYFHILISRDIKTCGILLYIFWIRDVYNRQFANPHFLCFKVGSIYLSRILYQSKKCKFLVNIL